MAAYEGQWLDADQPEQVAQVLRTIGWLNGPARVEQIQPAGDGNMNCTLRVWAGGQSVIVKQSRPWVQKYPSITAPVERVLAETRFYETVQPLPAVAGRMPQLIGSVPEQYVLVLQDLGSGNEGWQAYDDPLVREMCAANYEVLIQWLADLHLATRDLADRTRYANLELRTLNHDHIFQIPFADPPAVDLDAITPGLDDVARKVRRMRRVKEHCAGLGDLYLAPGNCLVHGDYFPGSWLLRDDGPYVIDPEFCYFGHAEFDLAVLAAHRHLIEGNEEASLSSVVQQVTQDYAAHGQAVDEPLVMQWAAVEILRRLLGVAQLPLQRSLAVKADLIEESVQTIVAA